MTDDSLVVRRADAADRPRVVELCRASLGWSSGEVDEAFFAWKHEENPAGTSPMWLAETPEGEVVGVRVFLRWRYRTADGDRIDAVRAVDTATHPEWQGRGIFRRLTLGALPELTADGVACVFNTPNDQSRPGYLKMGWSTVGRVPVAVRVRSPRSAVRLGGARTAAELWSEPTEVGVDAAEAFADEAAMTALLARLTAPARLHTDLTLAHLRWRYRFGPLRYRVQPLGSLGDGAIVFRLRRRGEALEATVCEVLAPPAARAAVRRGLGAVLRESGADYLLLGGDRSALRWGCLPLDRIGPILTWRTLASEWTPTMRDLSLSLGDVELF